MSHSHTARFAAGILSGPRPRGIGKTRLGLLDFPERSAASARNLVAYSQEIAFIVRNSLHCARSSRSNRRKTPAIAASARAKLGEFIGNFRSLASLKSSGKSLLLHVLS
jgi:hypothetical protein